MPSKSTTSLSPSFKTEAEEADWYASPEGRRFTSRAFQKAIREGKIIASSSTKPPSKELTNEALRSGSVIFYTKGMKFQPSDPAVLQKLLDDARASTSDSQRPGLITALGHPYTSSAGEQIVRNKKSAASSQPIRST